MGRRRNKPEVIWTRISNYGDYPKCWEWQGHVGADGYGRITISYTEEVVHYVAYRICFGNLPKNTHLMQTCGNKLCCNPEHLQLIVETEVQKLSITDQHWSRLNPEKLARGPRHGRRTSPNSTACGERNGNSKLSDKQVREIFILRSAGWTQQQLATRFEVGQPYVSRVLRRVLRKLATTIEA